jgi:hypothetical protein
MVFFEFFKIVKFIQTAVTLVKIEDIEFIIIAGRTNEMRFRTESHIVEYIKYRRARREEKQYA